jgi:hypothetical protein
MPGEKEPYYSLEEATACSAYRSRKPTDYSKGNRVVEVTIQCRKPGHRLHNSKPPDRKR